MAKRKLINNMAKECLIETKINEWLKNYNDVPYTIFLKIKNKILENKSKGVIIEIRSSNPFYKEKSINYVALKGRIDYTDFWRWLNSYGSQFLKETLCIKK